MNQLLLAYLLGWAMCAGNQYEQVRRDEGSMRLPAALRSFAVGALWLPYVGVVLGKGLLNWMFDK